MAGKLKVAEFKTEPGFGGGDVAPGETPRSRVKTPRDRGRSERGAHAGSFAFFGAEYPNLSPDRFGILRLIWKNVRVPAHISPLRTWWTNGR